MMENKNKDLWIEGAPKKDGVFDLVLENGTLLPRVSYYRSDGAFKNGQKIMFYFEPPVPPRKEVIWKFED